jgi:hypothetical protein
MGGTVADWGPSDAVMARRPSGRGGRADRYGVFRRAGGVVHPSADPDLCPGRVLLEHQGTVAGELEAGGQSAGDGGAAAQRFVRVITINPRQKRRQRPAVGRGGEQPAQMRHGIGHPPERRRPGTIRRRLVFRHAERDQAGAQQVGDVAGPAGRGQLRRAAREDIAA